MKYNARTACCMLYDADADAPLVVAPDAVPLFDSSEVGKLRILQDAAERALEALSVLRPGHNVEIRWECELAEPAGASGWAIMVVRTMLGVDEDDALRLAQEIDAGEGRGALVQAPSWVNLRAAVRAVDSAERYLASGCDD